MKWLAYVPVFGWFFPLFLGRDETDRFHARQGLGASLAFSLVVGGTWLVGHSIPDFLRIVPLVLYGAGTAGYLWLLAQGMIALARHEEKPLPYIGQRASRLPV